MLRTRTEHGGTGTDPGGRLSALEAKEVDRLRGAEGEVGEQSIGPDVPTEVGQDLKK